MTRPCEPGDKVMQRVVAGPNGCIVWTGARNSAGYGVLTVGGKRQYTHRASYSTFIGPIPAGLVLDHLCRNRSCCNPFHLEAVTSAENTRRGELAQRTHCPQGHPYGTDSKRRNSNKRDCRICHAAAERRRRAERKCCARGHEMTPENTITRRDGVRWCRTCRTTHAPRPRTDQNGIS